jgi:hypothetical protein
VVECTALEMRHTGNRIGSSNLPLSAKSSQNPDIIESLPLNGCTRYADGGRDPAALVIDPLLAVVIRQC